MNAVIQFDHVTKSYGAFTALSEVSLTIHEGEQVVLLGQNGAGKTTALRMLLGLIQPTSGSIVMCGQDPRIASARAVCGYLPGEMGWPLGVTAGEWIEYLAKLSGAPNVARRHELLATLEFPTERLKSYIGTLSQGMKRKLGLASAFESNPKLLILDEPGDGLDPVQQRQLLTLLKQREPASTLLLSSHDLREAYSIATRIIIFSQGKLVDDFPAADVSSIETLEQRFFKASNR